MQKIEVVDIARLNVKPGEVLLVTLPEYDRPEDIDYDSFKAVFQKSLPGVDVIVLTHGIKVEVVAKDAKL